MFIPVDSKLYRHRLERAATNYNQFSVVPDELANRLLEHLDLIKIEPARVLDLGAKTGFLAPQMEARFPEAQYIGAELSAKMLRHFPKPGWRERLRANLQRKPIPWKICVEPESLPLANASIDCCISNLALAWAADLDRVLHEVSRVMRENGLFIFSTLGPDSLTEIRTCLAQHSADDHVHAFLDMHDIGDALTRAGFADVVMDSEMLGVTYPDLSALSTELKSLGASKSLKRSAKTTATLRGRGFLQQLSDGLEAQSGRLELSLEVVYGHAWLPQSRAKRARLSPSSIAPIAHARGPKI